MITGDYRNVWAGEDFDKGEHLIRELMDDLDLELTRDLFMIPGNHDTDAQKKREEKRLFKVKEVDDDPRTHELKKLLPSGKLFP